MKKCVYLINISRNSPRLIYFAIFTAIGSIQERRAVEMAYKYSSRKDQAIYGLPTEDVKFSFELPDDVPIGKNVSVALKMKNTTYQRRTVKGKMTGMIGFYTGIPCKDLKEEVFEITVDPREGECHWNERLELKKDIKIYLSYIKLKLFAI